MAPPIPVTAEAVQPQPGSRGAPAPGPRTVWDLRASRPARAAGGVRAGWHFTAPACTMLLCLKWLSGPAEEKVRFFFLFALFAVT
jgi:hypothetical protein